MTEADRIQCEMIAAYLARYNRFGEHERKRRAEARQAALDRQRVAILERLRRRRQRAA